MNGDHEDCIRQALADAMLEKGEVSVRHRAPGHAGHQT